MARPKTPRKLDEVTPEWLSDALRDSDVLSEARVVGIEREPLGEGEGFLGQLERLHLRYDVAEPGAPTTLIAKLPTTVGHNRMLGELMGAYEREIFFYRDLASKLPCRVPRAYYTDMDLNPLTKHSAKILAWVDRRPGWIIAATMMLTLLIIRLSRRRYALLMEDMAPAKAGDQVAGATPERCRAALIELAALHASFWQSPQLDEHFWILRQDILVKGVGLLYRRARPNFDNRYLERHPELKPYLDWLDEHADELQYRFHGNSPHTLLHMDFRLDNLFFEDRAEDRAEDKAEDQAQNGVEDGSRGAAIAIFDWQTVARGPGVYDAAYFIAGSLAAHLGADTEKALIVAYHDALVAGGVCDYPLDRCLLDYQRALMLSLYRLATAPIIEFGEDRGDLLIDTWVERLSARISKIDLGKLF